MFVCGSVYSYVHGYQCLWRPEMSDRPRAGVIDNWEQSHVSPGMSLAEATHFLNCWAISPVPLPSPSIFNEKKNHFKIFEVKSWSVTIKDKTVLMAIYRPYMLEGRPPEERYQPTVHTGWEAGNDCTVQDQTLQDRPGWQNCKASP